MKWFLWFSVLLLVVAHLAESGRIVRTWRRQGRVGPRMRFRPRPYPMWSFFRRPRILRRNHHPFRFENQRGGSAEPQFPQQRVASIQIPSGSFQDSKHAGWRPLNFGNPINRDPTFAYAPPSNELVKFAAPRRRPMPGRNKFPIRGWRGPRPPHPLWKILGYKQRRPPPRPPPRFERPEDEAEATHYVPNIVYFHTNDVVPPTLEPNGGNSSSMRPGFITDVPLYPTQPSSASEFKPMPISTVASEFKPMPVSSVSPGQDYVVKIVNFLDGESQSPRKGATILQPVTSTPQTGSSSTTQRSAPTPSEPTESLFDMIEPPEPINSFNINIDAAAEGSSEFIKIVPAPPKPSTTPKPLTTETIRPIFALRSSTQATTEESTTSSISVTSTTSSTTIYRLPTMPAYKKRPVFPKKPSPAAKSSREQMSDGDMSSSIMITGIRSKVKEYKPQMLANYTQLLAFDKVSETTEESSTLASTSLRPNSNSSVVVTASASPMQSFDPLNMIHSWLMKT